MRAFALLFSASVLLAQQPVLYHRGTINAASLAPFGLPNAPIARGSIFTVFGENLGPATGQQVSTFPIAATLGGVSLSVTQNGVTTPAYPIYVSVNQINAVMPSSAVAGPATLRLSYQGAKSNAITIVIGNSAPGIFALSSGGFGPGIVQNYPSAGGGPFLNSLAVPATPGETIVIWATGLGPVTFPDNVAPTAGNVAATVTATIGGQAAAVQYSGRSPCCSGVDQVVVNVPQNTPLGCWVPVTLNAGGVVSNTVTMAVAAPGATACSDTGNPLSTLAQTAGTQAFIHVERMNTVENLDSDTPVLKTVDKMYSRFYTRPASTYSFDPYLSYPPAGSCLVHQTSGDSYYNKSLRGALPVSASLSPQPNQTYNNGSQNLTITPTDSFFASTLGGTVSGNAIAMGLLGAGGSFTIDPGGANQKAIPLTAEPPPTWARSNALILVPRNAPLALSFTPGDSAAPTAIVIYAYSSSTNATVEVQCLAAPGASSFTISADTLANLPATYQVVDGSYANLLIGTLGVNHAVSFTNGLAANGVLLNSSWLGQSVVLQ
jgi:uncharacterized protein (TIGR03437 family)